MATYVTDPDGLLAACKELPNWPATGKGLNWLSHRSRAKCDPGNLSKAFKKGGESPLPPGAASWLAKALSNGRKPFASFVEERSGPAKRRDEPTTIAFPNGHRAFEHAKNLALGAAEDLQEKRAKMLVWSCEISKHMVTWLVEAGWHVDLLVSNPTSYQPGKSKDIDPLEGNNKFRTSTIFMFKGSLEEAVKRSNGRGSLRVFGYNRFDAPFRGLSIDGVGIAIGPYEMVKGHQGRTHNIFGDELPAVFISVADPAHRQWQWYFDKTFTRQSKDRSKPLMVVDANDQKILDKDTDSWIEQLKALGERTHSQ